MRKTEMRDKTAEQGASSESTNTTSSLPTTLSPQATVRLAVMTLWGRTSNEVANTFDEAVRAVFDGFQGEKILPCLSGC